MDLDVAAGDGTVMLTGRQAGVLQQTLTSLNLRGQLPVRVLDTRDRRATPGGWVDLDIGGRLVSVPPDPDIPPRSPDFGPVGLLVGACMLARLSMPTAERVPFRVVLPLMVSMVAAAGVAEVRLRQRGSPAQDEVQTMALAISAAATVLATVTARRPFKPSGGQNFPFYSTMSVPTLLYAFQRQDLSPRVRRLIPAGMVAIAASGWVLATRPRQFGQFLLALSWPLSGLLAGLKVSDEFRADARRLAESLRARDRSAINAAFDRGVTSVVRLVRAAHADAMGQLQANRSRLDPDLARVAEQRLEEVNRCLDQLDLIDVSPSLTTTSSA